MNKSKNQLMSVYPEELANKSVAFFSLGDKEVQDRWLLANINDVLDKLALYLKVKTLLYDVVLHSTSFYIESDLSRLLYMRNDILPLFSSISSPVSSNLFVLSEDADTFYEHVEKKRRTTPKSFTAYHSSEVRQRILEMRSFKSVFRRTLGIGDIIARLWTEDLKKVDDNASIAHMVEASKETGLEAKYKNLFYSIIKDRGEMQLSPEYVSERLRRESVPLKLAESVQNRLLDFYVAGSSQAMSAYPIMPDELLTNDLKHPTVNPFSISLFMNFANILGITDYLRKMSGEQIIILKYQPEFSTFISHYLAIVREAQSVKKNVTNLHLQIYGEEAAKSYLQYNAWIQGVAAASLVAAFELCFGELGRFLAPMSPILVGLVDSLLRRLTPLERAPFLDFKQRVIEEYDANLRKTLSLSTAIPSSSSTESVRRTIPE